MSERVCLSVEEALSRITDGEEVHTILNPSGFLLGANWKREKLIEEMTAAAWIEDAGPHAHRFNHGIAFLDRKKRVVFVETKAPTLPVAALDPPPESASAAAGPHP